MPRPKSGLCSMAYGERYVGLCLPVIMSTPRITIPVDTALLCAAGQLVTVLLVGVVCNRGAMYNSGRELSEVAWKKK